MIFDVNKNIFGLDISDRALRLVQLKKSGNKIILASYNALEIPADVIAGGEIKQEEKLAELIKKLVKTANGKKIKTKNTVTVLPETKTFIKVIDVPSVGNDEELAEIIKEEIKNHIPLSSDEIYLDWQILAKQSGSTKVLIGAAPKYIVDSYFSVIEKSGLVPYALEIESAAIVRSLFAKDDKTAKIIVDFGAVRTGLIIYSQKAIPFTITLPISGNKITDTIATTLKLDPLKAEKAKIVCGLDPKKCEGALLKILLKPIQSIADQIKKAIIFYKSNFSINNEISEVILCGGGANFSNIDKILAEKLNLTVKIGNPLTNIAKTKKIKIPPDKILSYTTAIGLALRAFQKKDVI
ncbi:MAG: type IV pilus assembly protein PilM [Patescibacteria group bacterium]|jgi:type IV pilus assembly protein PilM